MVRTSVRIALVAACLVSACLVVGTSWVTPAGAAPILPVDVAKGIGLVGDQASFWGEPYPYGYAYRGGRRCLREVRVDTPSGWRYRRIWVCNGADEVILRSRG